MFEQNHPFLGIRELCVRSGGEARVGPFVDRRAPPHDLHGLRRRHRLGGSRRLGRNELDRHDLLGEERVELERGITLSGSGAAQGRRRFASARRKKMGVKNGEQSQPRHVCWATTNADRCTQMPFPLSHHGEESRFVNLSRLSTF